jgi:HSP20 family molecular chaperone IbpA
MAFPVDASDLSQTLTLCIQFSIDFFCHLALPKTTYHIGVKRDAGVFGSASSRFTQGLWTMTRMTTFASPLLLGFDAMEKTLERIAKANDGYPPYNIERLAPDPSRNFVGGLKITLAVAGFSEDELDVTTEENQLIIRGRQTEQGERDYLHRGIAARQFQRMFVLADGMQVQAAVLKNGLLSVDIMRPEPERLVRKINISVSE